MTHYCEFDYTVLHHNAIDIQQASNNYCVMYSLSHPHCGSSMPRPLNSLISASWQNLLYCLVLITGTQRNVITWVSGVHNRQTKPNQTKPKPFYDY